MNMKSIGQTIMRLEQNEIGQFFLTASTYFALQNDMNVFFQKNDMKADRIQIPIIIQSSDKKFYRNHQPFSHNSA